MTTTTGEGNSRAEVPPSLWAAPLVAGWLAVGVVDAIVFELTVPGSSVPLRLAYHAYALGLCLACGLALRALAALGRRWLPERARTASALAVGGLGGLALLSDDLESFAYRAPVAPGALLALLSVAGGTAVAAVWPIGRRLARVARGRVLASALAIGISAVHHWLLTSGYDSLHFAAGTAAALLLASAHGDALSARWSNAAMRWSGKRHAVEAALVAAAVLALVLPSREVVLESLRLPGNGLGSLAAASRRALFGTRRVAAPGDHTPGLASSWLRDRSGLPQVPPSRAVPVPGDLVVVVVTVDALRADVVDEPRFAKLPGFRRLAAESVRFRRAWSTAPATTGALTALMTGKYYSQLFWSKRAHYGKTRVDMRYFADEDPSPSFAHALGDAGIESAAFVSAEGLTEGYGVVKGFTEEPLLLSSADEIVRAVLERIDRAPGPLLVYAHWIEPHAPYAGKKGSAFDRYLGEVATVDRALTRLMRGLFDTALAPRAALIVTADHGEAFGEHGTSQHAKTVYEELVRIPLFVRVPGVPARVSDVPVSLIDVGPTVLDLFGVTTPAAFMGQSLVPLLPTDAAVLERPLVIDSPRRMQALIEGGRHKLIRDLRHDTFELYDLERDPGETDNLFERDPERAERLSAALVGFFEAHTLRRPGYEPPYRP